MSDYSNNYDGAAKDAANDTILGAEIEAELDNIETAIATKIDAVSSATVNGVPKLDSNGDLNNSTVTLDANDELGVKGYSELAESYTVTTGTKDLDLHNGATYFYPASAMTAVAYTFTFSNPVSSGRVSSFILELNSAGTASSITWPTGVDWANGGVEPTWSTSGIDIVTFITRDGGTTWLGFLGGLDFA